MGHSEGASGVTSMIKIMLAMEKGMIPPNRNFEVPNPRSKSLVPERQPLSHDNFGSIQTVFIDP